MYIYEATLLRIVDADTIDVSLSVGLDIYTHQRLRLYGINAPETNSKDAAERSKARRAQEFVTEALPTGERKLVVMTHKDRTCKYGRYLATVFADGNPISVNDALVTAGLAEPYMTAA